MQISYPAFFIEDEGGYTIVFPDLPGCFAAADSMTSAFVVAQQVLEAHLKAIKKAGKKRPTPSEVLSVVPEAEYADFVIHRQLIPVNVESKTVRTNLTIEESLLEVIDLVAPNRSVFFAEAARNELMRRQKLHH